MLRRVENEAAASDIVRLTRGLAEGEEVAFREFHAKYFDRLYRFLLVIARGQEHEAQEALQETFLRVARRGREFTDEETFWCWLKVVARNAARDGGRSRSRYATLLYHFALGRSCDNEASATEDEDQLSAVLTECMSELPPEDRRLLEGKYLDGATVRELATLTSRTEKAVESRLGRLRGRLRCKLLRKLKTP